MRPPPDTRNSMNSYRDNTMLEAYKVCPRKYFLRHVMNWRGTGTALPLIFGSSWHAAQDIIWQHANTLSKPNLVQAAMANFAEKWESEGLSFNLDHEQIEAFNPRTPSVAEEMIHAYIDTRWPILSECELLSCEAPFAVPLPNIPDTWYIGRLDKVVSYQGNKIVIEHKTTTIYKKDGHFQSSYIESWFSDSQCKGYLYGAGLYYPGLSQIWIDCALVHKTVHSGFRFVPVSHSFPIMQEWITDTEEWIRRVAADEHKFLASGNRLVHGAFPKNEGSCFGKFGTCPYIDICRTQADPSALTEVPEGYQVEKWEPFITLGLDKVLTGEQTA